MVWANSFAVNQMQFRFLAALAVYFASYLPLSVILMVQDFEFDRIGGAFCNPFTSTSQRCKIPLDHPVAATAALAVCSIALVWTLITLHLTSPGQSITIKEAKHVPADLMNYTLPYVVSLIGLDYKDPAKLLGFLVFFLWMFVITYCSGRTILNPVLTVFGWQLYEVTYEFQAGSQIDYSGVVLSHVPVEIGKVYPQAPLQNVLVIKSA